MNSQDCSEHLLGGHQQQLPSYRSLLLIQLVQAGSEHFQGQLKIKDQLFRTLGLEYNI